MAPAPIAIVATAVTLTATLPKAACSRRFGFERPVLAAFMVILRLFWLIALTSPPEHESSWGEKGFTGSVPDAVPRLVGAFANGAM